MDGWESAVVLGGAQSVYSLFHVLMASSHLSPRSSMWVRSSGHVIMPSFADAYASLSNPEQPKQLQSTFSPAGTGHAPTSLHIAMHCGVPSIISARSAIFFDTAILCFSDSAHASVEPKRESAETAAATRSTRILKYVR